MGDPRRQRETATALVERHGIGTRNRELFTKPVGVPGGRPHVYQQDKKEKAVIATRCDGEGRHRSSMATSVGDVRWRR